MTDTTHTDDPFNMSVEVSIKVHEYLVIPAVIGRGHSNLLIQINATADSDEVLMDFTIHAPAISDSDKENQEDQRQQLATALGLLLEALTDGTEQQNE